MRPGNLRAAESRALRMARGRGVASSLRRIGHPPAGIQLSGMAAEDARDSQIMMIAMLGARSIAFGAALPRTAGHRPAMAPGAAAAPGAF
jgi:hypothetical protein